MGVSPWAIAPMPKPPVPRAGAGRELGHREQLQQDKAGSPVLCISTEVAIVPSVNSRYIAHRNGRANDSS